jgi:O-antigen/teichoic acid export membrane protein
MLAQSTLCAAMLVGIAIKMKWIPLLRFRQRDLEGFVGFGLFQMGERCLNYFSSNVDYLVIGRYLGSGPLGYYTLAYKLATLPLNYINTVITSVAFPVFSHVKNDNAALRAGYMKILFYISSLTFPLLAGLFVVADILVKFFYGDAWLAAVPVIRIFCLLAAMYTLGNPIGCLLLAKGRADIGFWFNVVAVVGRTVATIIGFHWDILGVAVAVLLFDIIVLLPLDIVVRRRLIGMTLRQFLSPISAPLYSSLAMVLALIALKTVWPVAVPGLLLSRDVLFGAVVYSAVMYLLARDPISEVWDLARVRLGRHA